MGRLRDNWTSVAGTVEEKEMAETKTKPTKVSVRKFIAAVENDTRRKDATTLLKVFKDATGWKSQMLGPTIVGFGLYHYKYDTGHSGAACVVGFSPRKANLVVSRGSRGAQEDP